MDKYEALKTYFGHSSFREGQEPLIDALLSGRDALGIMPTGAGKSVCYQIPAAISDGVTVVISPLISLMKDQVNALNQMGIRAAYLNSSLTERQFALALKKAYAGEYKIIYAAPERLETEGFRRLAGSIKISLLAVDEAHCISQWGQDFRPSYIKISEFIRFLPYRPPIGAFTATATARVKDDIIRLLGLENPKLVTTGFDRRNLYFGVEHPADKFDALLRILKRNEGKSGIVYCTSRKNVREVCGALIECGFDATMYHAGLPDEERIENQDDFLYDRKTIMVATNAFGMGIDKSNVSFVVHYNMPKDIESYYQEAGRAGRDGSEAECILLYSKSDYNTIRYFIENPADNDELTDEQRQQIKKQDYERLRQMTFYSTTQKCLRRFILDYFGDYRECKCGKCSSCLPEMQEEKRAAAGNKKTKNIKPSGNDALFERLKKVRLNEAYSLGVPAFTVFSDATLRDMCRKKPKTIDEFMEVNGVGAVKAKRFGAVFVSEIRQFCGLGVKDVKKHWEQSEKERLKNEIYSGKTLGELAKLHGCGIEEIIERLKDLK
ncbi:MAG: RecQ family ATP-dependent DNA helicase [Clostridiales bacterium]|nr:RecQ family ATP-dependent DNA helicase [Clostridiales bacterium]